MHLNFNYHINHIVAKAYKQWGLIWNIAKKLSPECLKLLYCSFVRSNLEYASTIWSPYTVKNIVLIEKVQNKFLRSMEYKIGLTHEMGRYNDIIVLLNTQTLSSRRKIVDLRILHKILSRSIECENLLKSLTSHASQNSYYTRGSHLFKIPKYKSNYTANCPMSRLILLANSCNKHHWFNLSDSYYQFKNKLKKYNYIL